MSQCINTPMASHGRHSGFTLVELLVVVAIIVILIALLLPAMDRAMYLTELTVCGARLDAIGGTLLTSAVDHQRKYPERKAIYIAEMVTLAARNPNERDDRPALREYFQGSLNKLLQCPLLKPVDVESPSHTSSIDIGYTLRYGWWTGPGFKPMRKLGDRWTATDYLSGKTLSFSLLAEDFELMTDRLYLSHPDDKGMLSNLVVETPTGWLAYDSMGVPFDGGRTHSSWYSLGTEDPTLRGRVDMNYLYEDGSVQRLDRIGLVGEDDRMAAISWWWGQPTYHGLSDFAHVPAR